MTVPDRIEPGFDLVVTSDRGDYEVLEVRQHGWPPLAPVELAKPMAAGNWRRYVASLGLGTIEVGWENTDATPGA